MTTKIQFCSNEQLLQIEPCYVQGEFYKCCEIVDREDAVYRLLYSDELEDEVLKIQQQNKKITSDEAFEKVRRSYRHRRIDSFKGFYLRKDGRVEISKNREPKNDCTQIVSVYKDDQLLRFYVEKLED